jgi:hypothetical protein
MAITYTLKSFDTSPISAISNLTTLTDINIEDIHFEQTVGEKMWLESGELTIETYTQISSADWIALYINNILAEVFAFRQVKYDEKRGKYTYNLFPIQKTFMDDLADTLVDYSADTEDWAYDIPNAELTIGSFGVLDGDGNTQTGTSISGYQPLRMVKAMIDKSQRLGYHVYTANYDGSTITDTTDGKGTLIRGTGVSSSDTDQNKINGTFSTNGTDVFDVNWFQIFELLIHSYNAYVRITPTIVSGTPDSLGITIDITPRENVSAGSPISVLTFIERVLINNKYQISGVLIEGENFEYHQGKWNAANAFKATVDVYDYTVPEADYDIALYYRGISGGNAPWFNGGYNVSDYYNGLISTGHGYEGECEIIYNDGAEKLLKLLDQVTFSGTNIMINKLSVGVSVRAKFEGVVI